ncbi:MAG: M15 family metallopeptidase [Prevotella sp.]|nr:M15 family metallopeptidase [Prevotella sp.]
MEKNRWAKSLLTLFFLLLSTLGTWAQTGTQALVQWQAGHAVTQQEAEAYGLDRCFSAQPLSETVFARMQGHSYPADCTVSRDELRYIRTLHWHHDGTLLIGELVCNRAIADDLVDIFRTLYRHHYPIERMQLIDDYGADDEHSMRANNTSCFCFRRINGSKRLSKHARGIDIDITPLYNPYVKRRKDGTYFLQPATATPYRDRTQSFRYKIDTRDLCYRLFIQHGFRWGGAWKSHQDYQHFEK